MTVAFASITVSSPVEAMAMNRWTPPRNQHVRRSCMTLSCARVVEDPPDARRQSVTVHGLLHKESVAVGKRRELIARGHEQYRSFGEAAVRANDVQELEPAHVRHQDIQ